MTAFTAYTPTEPEEVTPRELGNALKRRKELDLFAFERDLFDIVPIVYGKLIRDAKDTIIHARSDKPGHRWVIDGETAGRLLGLTKDERRRLGITTMRAIDETPEEREAYRKAGHNEREKLAKRAAARAARPRKETVAERAKRLGVSLRTYYRQLKKAREAAASVGGTLSVDSRTFSSTGWASTGNTATSAATETAAQSEPIVLRAAPERGPSRDAPEAHSHAASHPAAEEETTPVDGTSAKAGHAGQEPIEAVILRRYKWGEDNPDYTSLTFDLAGPNRHEERSRAAFWLAKLGPREKLVRELGVMAAARDAFEVTMRMLKARDAVAGFFANEGRRC